MKVGIAVGVVIAILALVICLAPLKEVAYAVTVDYEDTETYYENEPYQVTENYSEAVPCDYRVIESYDEIVKVLYRDDEEIPGVPREAGFGDQAPKGHVVVKNTDNATGTFIVQFSFCEWDEYMSGFFPIKNYQEGEVTLHIEPGQSDVAVFLAHKLGVGEGEGGMREVFDFDTGKSVYISYEPGGWDWEYAITEATKTIEQERTVTKYRQVEKQRTVIKQRQETQYKKVTLLDYLLHY
jgi:hypothetical protein